MDPFDEFEFKPLTEGLGFHRKPVQAVDEVEEMSASESPQFKKGSRIFDDLPKVEIPSAQSLLKKKSEPVFEKPASRPNVRKPQSLNAKPMGDIEKPSTSSNIFPNRKSRSNVPEIEEASLDRHLDFVENSNSKGVQKASRQSPRRMLLPVPVSIMALALDLIVILALSLMFLSALLFVTDVSLGLVIGHAKSDKMARLSLGLLIFAVTEMYMIVSRSFFGNSLGEWAFNLQLGNDEQQKKLGYPLRVVLRTMVNAVTGFVLLPLLSLIARRDLAGMICQLPLFKY